MEERRVGCKLGVCVCVRVSKTSRVHEGRIAGLCVAM